MTTDEIQKRINEASREINRIQNGEISMPASQINTFIRDIAMYLGLGGVYQNVIQWADKKSGNDLDKAYDLKIKGLNDILNDLNKEVANLDQEYSTAKEKSNTEIGNLVSDIAALNFGSSISLVDRKDKQKRLREKVNELRGNQNRDTYNYYVKSADLESKTRKIQRQIDDASQLKLDPYLDQVNKLAVRKEKE